jgi:hypothetical protein
MAERWRVCREIAKLPEQLLVEDAKAGRGRQAHVPLFTSMSISLYQPSHQPIPSPDLPTHVNTTLATSGFFFFFIHTG